LKIFSILNFILTRLIIRHKLKIKNGYFIHRNPSLLDKGITGWLLYQPPVGSAHVTSLGEATH